MCDFEGLKRWARQGAAWMVDNSLYAMLWLFVNLIVILIVVLSLANILLYGLKGDLSPLNGLAPFCFQLAGFVFVGIIFERVLDRKHENNFLIKNLVRASAAFFLAGFFFTFIQGFMLFEKVVGGIKGEMIGKTLLEAIFTLSFLLGLLCFELGLLLLGRILIEVVDAYLLKPTRIAGKPPSPKKNKNEKSRKAHARRR